MTLKDKQDAEAFKDDLYDSMPDYTKFANGADLLEALGDEGMKWAAAFCQTTKKRFDIDIELGYALGWFANCVENTKLINTPEKYQQEHEQWKNTVSFTSGLTERKDVTI